MAETPIALTRKAAGVFDERGIENARLEAELLLASVLGIRRLDLYLQYDRPLTSEEVDAYRRAVRRRLRHEPVQYIVGEVGFRELTLKVDRRALIPRPETEALVGQVLAWAVERERERGERLTALDVGTGAGPIALSLVREGPFERVVATDASEEALELAGENARRTGLADAVELRVGRVWDPIAEGERFDAVVSNPPYVAESERETLPPEVREWEPEAALFAADRGLRILDEIVAGAGSHLERGGLLALEVGLGQAREIAAQIEAEGGYGAVRVERDLAERERIVLARRTETDSSEHPDETEGDG